MTTGTSVPFLVAESRVMRSFVAELEHVAQSDAPVLIWGEPGVGKERAARLLHLRSPRRNQPFEVLRCIGLDAAGMQAALTDVLSRTRGGSLLLDGVEALAEEAQVELLRVLYSPLPPLAPARPRRRLGQAPRWICNAAEHLEPLVRRGRLRRDLHHRLAVVRLHLPPLRARKDDLAALSAALIAEQSHDGTPAFAVEEEVLSLFRDYPWPGNVRELGALLQQAAWRVQEGMLRAGDLADLLCRTATNASVQIPLGTSLAVAEQTLLRATLAACGGNKKRTAEALGICRRTLYLKLGRTEPTAPCCCALRSVWLTPEYSLKALRDGEKFRAVALRCVFLKDILGVRVGLTSSERRPHYEDFFSEEWSVQDRGREMTYATDVESPKSP
ncbi:MAG: sigma 54-interacting transcriptional regulator [Polyangia bacterium]